MSANLARVWNIRVPGLGRHQRRLRRRPPRCRWDDLLGLLPLFSIMKIAKSTRRLQGPRRQSDSGAGRDDHACDSDTLIRTFCMRGHQPTQSTDDQAETRKERTSSVKKRQNQRARKFKACRHSVPEGGDESDDRQGAVASWKRRTLLRFLVPSVSHEELQEGVLSR